MFDHTTAAGGVYEGPGDDGADRGGAGGEGVHVDPREPSRYMVGIDLGTTNSAVAYIDSSERWSGGPPVRAFDVPQLVQEGAVARRATLPSYLYLPGPHELPAGALSLPWDGARAFAVGEFARVQGARVPGHLVSSAKSWLCHGDVDRGAPILPWGGADDVDKLSPVEVSSRYLAHIREAWNEAMAATDPTLCLEHQDVVLTIPASFDEVARELTLEAAKAAGLERLHLLEEPQAAFYAWLANHASNWSDVLRADQLILVCDIGGGTTDFSLIVTREGRQGLRFERIAVGEHLMLGGDNMDLALAKLVEGRLGEEGVELDAQAMAGVIHACREAKEELLARSSAAAVPIGVTRAGASLVGGFVQTELGRDETRDIVVDGFFPKVEPTDEPLKRQSGLQEWGLPYVADAAVTKHLAAFLRRHALSAGGAADPSGLARPDLVLWNGAALTPPAMRQKLVDVVSSWFRANDPNYALEVLENPDLRLAVAHGAAYYGVVRRGRGVRIHGGSARGYYVGVDTQEAAGSDLEDPVSCVCLVRRGTEEGETVELDRGFAAHVNQPVAFSLFSSSVRTDENGALIHVERDELGELPPIRTVLRFGSKAGERRIPVGVGAHLTEVGTLDLFCVSRDTDHRWRLNFQLRRDPGEEHRLGTTIDQGVTLEEAIVERLEGLVRAAFVPGAADRAAERVTPQNLARQLRGALDMERGEWPLPALRKLAELLLEVRDERRRSVAHESRWLNLIGYCLRPGFGYPMDDWRLRELWKIWHAGVVHASDEQCRTEWWILWRRVAGGLTRGQQDQLLPRLVGPLTASAKPPSRARPGKKKKKQKGAAAQPARRLGKQERLEMWMTAASLEEVDPRHKAELGQVLVDGARESVPNAQALWAIARLGARVPFAGPANQVVKRQVVERWIEVLMDRAVEEQAAADQANEDRALSPALARAVAHLARRTGDRQRDIGDAQRERLIAKLEATPDANRWAALVREGGELAEEEEAQVFGEALPAGLVLAEEIGA